MNPWAETMHDNFHKWHLNDGRILHWFTGADSSDPHDHNFDIEVEVLRGGYVEEAFNRAGTATLVERRAGDKFTIGARHIHRITHLPHGECFTICRYGPKVQEPAFYRWQDGAMLRRQWDEVA